MAPAIRRRTRKPVAPWLVAAGFFFDTRPVPVPSFPPASAFAAARTRHQQALEAQRPSGVTINGKFYKGAIELGPLEWLPVDGGTSRGQRLTAHVMKTLLATPPGQKTLVYHDGVEFKVQEIGGRNATDVAWVLKCVRWMD